MDKLILPKFANEAEEAQWWFDHREALSDEFLRAEREGRLGEGSMGRYMRKQRALAEAAQEAAESVSGSQRSS